MTKQEKLVLLEDIFEIDPGQLKEETVLDGLENWDSMTKLSLIVLMDDKFGKKVAGKEIEGLKTVRDILEIMTKV